MVTAADPLRHNAATQQFKSPVVVLWGIRRGYCLNTWKPVSTTALAAACFAFTATHDFGIEKMTESYWNDCQQTWPCPATGCFSTCPA
jgi:hypothetical protein